MEQIVAEQVAEVLKALAHPLRLRIIEVLADVEKSVGQIVSELGANQAVVSQHLNFMKDKGILTRRRQGTRVYYSIHNLNVITLLQCIYNHCNQGRETE